MGELTIEKLSRWLEDHAAELRLECKGGMWRAALHARSDVEPAMATPRVVGYDKSLVGAVGRAMVAWEFNP